ncbi:MAG: hypothetical protein AAFQ80_00405 [Cyanobacteria bacterium J06621_8]
MTYRDRRVIDLLTDKNVYPVGEFLLSCDRSHTAIENQPKRSSTRCKAANYIFI